MHDATEVLFGVSCEEAFEQPDGVLTQPDDSVAGAHARGNAESLKNFREPGLKI